nr:cytochrome d ubiquinol oxidase subunit II [Pseudomonas fluorescens]
MRSLGYLAHRTEGAIQARAIKGSIGAAIVLVCSFIVAGIWLQSIDGYRITSVVDTPGLPDILNKSVVRETGAWMANYGHYPLLWLLPVLGLVGAAGAAILLMMRRTLSAFVASSLAVIGVISTAGVSMFPFQYSAPPAPMLRALREPPEFVEQGEPTRCLRWTELACRCHPSRS